MDKEELQIELELFLKREGVIPLWNLCSEAIYNYSGRQWKEKEWIYEVSCPALQNLATKKDLNHRERTALLLTFIKLGKRGEEKLWEIMRQQTNFSEQTTKRQIESYKKKGKFYGISCEKMIEWGICGEKFSDCPKFKEIPKNA